VISGEADDSVENLIVTNAFVVNDIDDDELVDPQEHAGGAGEEILAMGLTDVVLAEPMDPNHGGCQVLFRNLFARVVVAFLVIFLVIVTGTVAGILSSVPPEGGSGVGEGLEGEMVLPASSPMTHVPSTPFTAYPTAAPVTHRFAKIKDIVSSVSDSDTLEDENSPQFLALSWLVDEDSAQLISEAHDQIKQRYIIAVLYFSLENVSWLLECGFMGDQHECSWSCDDLMNNSYNVRLVCGSKRVTVVKLSGFGLSGTIPAELGYLSELREMYLNNNKLVGTIPPTLGHLTKLKVLDLNDNDLTGNIPSELSGMSSIARVYLNGNPKLTGDLTFFCIVEWPLEVLNIDCIGISLGAVTCECCTNCRL